MVESLGIPEARQPSAYLSGAFPGGRCGRHRDRGLVPREARLRDLREGAPDYFDEFLEPWRTLWH